MAKPTLNPVAHHRVAHCAPHHDPSTRGSLFLRGRQQKVDREDSTRRAGTTPNDVANIRPRRQPVRDREHSAELRREARAALAPATGQDGAAGTGAHTQTETMRLGTTPVVGLESALHVW